MHWEVFAKGLGAGRRGLAPAVMTGLWDLWLSWCRLSELACGSQSG